MIKRKLVGFILLTSLVCLLFSMQSPPKEKMTKVAENQWIMQPAVISMPMVYAAPTFGKHIQREFKNYNIILPDARIKFATLPYDYGLKQLQINTLPAKITRSFYRNLLPYDYGLNRS